MDTYSIEWLPQRHGDGSPGQAIRDGHRCRLLIPNLIELIPQISEFVMTVMEGLLASDQAAQVRTALVEALSNAMVHGNLEVDSSHKQRGDWGSHNAAVQAGLNDPKKAARRVRVDISVQDGGLRLEVEDEGAGFDASELEQLQPEDVLLREYGRGIMMIRFSMDSVSWNEQRNRIEMFKALST